MARNVGKEEVPSGEPGPLGSLTSFLPVSAWFWGCWLWLTFVIVEDQKDPPPLKGPQSRCRCSSSSGDLRLGGSKGLCRDF